MLLRRIIDRLLWRRIVYLDTLDDDRFVVRVPIRVLLEFDVSVSEWHAQVRSLLEHGWGDSPEEAIAHLKRRIADGWISQHRVSGKASRGSESMRRSLSRHIDLADGTELEA